MPAIDTHRWRLPACGRSRHSVHASANPELMSLYRSMSANRCRFALDWSLPCTNGLVGYYIANDGYVFGKGVNHTCELATIPVRWRQTYFAVVILPIRWSTIFAGLGCLDFNSHLLLTHLGWCYRSSLLQQAHSFNVRYIESLPAGHIVVHDGPTMAGAGEEETGGGCCWEAGLTEAVLSSGSSCWQSVPYIRIDAALNSSCFHL
jgi:hypothetical protein